MVLNYFARYESWYTLLRCPTLPPHSLYEKSNWSKTEVFILDFLKPISCSGFYVFDVRGVFGVPQR